MKTHQQFFQLIYQFLVFILKAIIWIFKRIRNFFKSKHTKEQEEFIKFLQDEENRKKNKQYLAKFSGKRRYTKAHAH